LSLTLESARGPRDVYVLEPETQALTRWTDSELGPLDPTQLIAPALVRYPTWDHIDGQPRMLSAYVYRSPATAAATALHPVLILLRTGAGTQYRPGFEPLAQFLARELGYVVIAPNVRGATGYGRSFEQLGEGALRDDAARDIGSLLVWIGLQHELDFNHIAVMGEVWPATWHWLACRNMGIGCMAASWHFRRMSGPVRGLAPFDDPCCWFTAAAIRTFRPTRLSSSRRGCAPVARPYSTWGRG